MICTAPHLLQPAIAASLVPWLHLAGIVALLAVMADVALGGSSLRRRMAQSHRIHALQQSTRPSLHAMLQAMAYGV